MPDTTKEAPTIRLFLAPINEPVNGGWYPVSGLSAKEDIRSAMHEVREWTGKEELRISDAEGLPSSMIPPYGGVPVEKIHAFCLLAQEHGLPAARAYVEVLDATGAEVPPEEWIRSFERAHAGVQDSRTAWAEERVFSGAFPSLARVAEKHGIGYINIDRVRSDIEHDAHTEFVKADDGTHLFIRPDLTL